MGNLGTEEFSGPVLVREEEPRPFVDHLEELRRRLLRSFLWVGIGAAISWRFAGSLLALLVSPVGQVVYLSPVEPFLVHLKAAFLGGLAISFPLLAWECWGFFRPALRPRERWAAGLFLPVSTGLFAVGVWFGWKWLLPSALKILQSFGAAYMTPMLTVGHYLSFAGWLVVGCGLIFQVPLVVLLLARLGVVRPAALARAWRPALVGIFLAAAVLTPTPDVFTQLLLAAPLAGLYGISVILSFWIGGNR